MADPKMQKFADYLRARSPFAAPGVGPVQVLERVPAPTVDVTMGPLAVEQRMMGELPPTTVPRPAPLTRQLLLAAALRGTLPKR